MHELQTVIPTASMFVHFMNIKMMGGKYLGQRDHSSLLISTSSLHFDFVYHFHILQNHQTGSAMPQYHHMY